MAGTTEISYISGIKGTASTIGASYSGSIVVDDAGRKYKAAVALVTLLPQRVVLYNPQYLIPGLIGLGSYIIQESKRIDVYPLTPAPGSVWSDVLTLDTKTRDLTRLGSLDASIGWFRDAPDPGNPDSVPNTDYWDTQWSCQDWIDWHMANVAAYGKDTANHKFKQYASQVSSVASDHFCIYEPSFQNYFKSQGIDFDNFIASLAVVGQNVATDAGTIANNAAGGIANASSTLSWLLPVALVVGAVGVGIWAKNEFLDKPKVHGIKKMRIR